MDCVFPPNYQFLAPNKDTPSKILGPSIQPENHLDSC